MLRTLCAIFVFTASLGLAQVDTQEVHSHRDTPQAAEESAAKRDVIPPPGPNGLYVDSGTGQLPIWIPEKERLAFAVELDVAIIGKTRVGSFVITSKVGRHRAGLPAVGKGKNGTEGKKPLRKGHIQALAGGGYLGYTLDHSIDARILPQEWPRVIVRDYQKGSENRRREVMYGTRDGKSMSWYRRDRHCQFCERQEHFVNPILGSKHHCNGCKRGEHRDWDTPKVQPIPDGALDMISAIFLARELVRQQGDRIDFPLLDKDSWWDLTMVLGDRAEIKTPAGVFACQAVKLDPKPPAGVKDRKKFKGLFGIHGTLSIWLHESTGVPVMIEGLVPLGPMDLDVSISLVDYQDTPKGFKAVSPSR